MPALDPSPRRPSGWLLLLCALLTVGEPALLAYVWSPHIVMVIRYGPAAMLLFAARLLTTAIGLAAGLALWQSKPHATSMARLFLVLSTVMTGVILGTRILPGRPPPGTVLPLFLMAALYNAAWFAYLSMRRH
jgi:hypothetical protein